MPQSPEPHFAPARSVPSPDSLWQLLENKSPYLACWLLFLVKMALNVMVDGWNIVTRIAMARQAQGYTFP
jgi:hypothetical protein